MMALSLWKGWIGRPLPGVREVATEVAKRRGVTFADLAGPVGSRSLSVIRHEAMYESKERTGKSFSDVGRVFRRNHATVIHGYRRHAERIGA